MLEGVRYRSHVFRQSELHDRALIWSGDCGIKDRLGLLFSDVDLQSEKLPSLFGKDWGEKLQVE